MEYLVAVSSSDGTMVDTHFGRTRAFHIFSVRDNGAYAPVETRTVSAPCREGEHDQADMTAAVNALSDCRYVLSAQIGPGAQTALRARGITPLEVTQRVSYALEKVMLYDKKFKHDKHERD
ncbi:MAG: dinitrogenase iron-molybdenum cofactor biosynthesis protein [Oscillospiraceae bacterium]|nr:dinitrogenase iron-molybdenum cofactor biosynthesis protein [Oscillospiraceae bacterium]